MNKNNQKLAKQTDRRFRKAHAFLLKGEPTRALEICKDIIRQTPWAFPAYSYAAEASTTAKQYEEGLRYAETGLTKLKEATALKIRAPKEFAELHANLLAAKGFALSAQGCHQDAIAAFQESYAIEPQSRTLLQLGNALQSSGKLEEAEQQYILGVLETESPETATALYNNMAVLLESQGNFTDALIYFGRAATSSPADEAACTQFAKALMRAGRVDEAIAKLETIPHDEQTDAGQLLAQFTTLREIYLEVQDQIDLLSKELSRAPTTNLYRELADIYALTERSVKAIELLQQAMKFDPANADCVNDLGSIYQSNHLYKLGEALAERAAKTEFSGDPRIWSLLSLALASQDRPTEAQDAYRNSMKLLNLPTRPDHVISSVEALTGTACNLQNWPAVLTLIAIGVDAVTRSSKDRRELYRPNYNALRNRPALSAAKLLAKTDQLKDEQIQQAAGEFAYHLYKYTEVVVANTEEPHRGLSAPTQALDAFFTFYPEAQLILNNLVIERLECN